jgi:hypothetical protein
MLVVDFAPSAGRVFDLSTVLQGWNLTSSQAYRRVATAIDGDPREPIARADIFAIGDHEYLVPDESRYENGKLVESTVRLDQAKLVIDRPNGTRQIRDMKLSDCIPASVLSVLTEAVETCNPSSFVYAVHIIRPQL